jgi:ABC-2 type transport system permease protein
VGRRLASARRTTRLYLRLFEAQLKAVLEYQGDFLIQMVGAVLLNAAGFIFLWVLFQQIPTVEGWGLWEIVLMYALVIFSEGVGSLFFQGTWSLARLVNRGELDFALVRPLSPAAQVMAGGAVAGMNGVGNMLLGAVLIAKAFGHVHVDWTPARIALGIVLFVSSIVIKLALNLATNSAAFWLNSPNNSFPYSMHILGDLCRYPITIYGFGIQTLVALVVPFAFISFFPATAIFEKGSYWEWAGLVTPLVAAYCVFMAGWIFRRGLARYESSGN